MTRNEKDRTGTARDCCPSCGSKGRTGDMICASCEVLLCASCASMVEDMALCDKCRDNYFFTIALAGFI
jgi:hypothetical protein